MTADWKDPPPPSVANFTPPRLCLEWRAGLGMGASQKWARAFLPSPWPITRTTLH